MTTEMLLKAALPLREGVRLLVQQDQTISIMELVEGREQEQLRTRFDTFFDLNFALLTLGYTLPK